MVVGLIQQYPALNPTTTGGGQCDPHPYKSAPNTRIKKKRKKRTQKMALPNPPHPTNTQRFIVYISIPSTKLVECNKPVKTRNVFIHSIYKEKTSKKPSPGRVKCGKTAKIHTKSLSRKTALLTRQRGFRFRYLGSPFLFSCTKRFYGRFC